MFWDPLRYTVIYESIRDGPAGTADGALRIDRSGLAAPWARALRSPSPLSTGESWRVLALMSQ